VTMVDATGGGTMGSDAPSTDASNEGRLTHLDERGRVRMVDVGAKPVTARTAVASCEVRVRPDVARLVADGTLPKGDALALARVAGIQAAKRTPELVPLCHQVALTSVELELEVDVERGTIDVTATAAAVDRTGVEMEAMTAAAVAALTVYDLVKAVQRDAVIGGLRLRSKTGGRSGDLELP
jgi:cyclic pyranopterin phosphate synthase